MSRKLSNKKPLVSVIMPVYNGEIYLIDSINSILNQTFKDFEFLIINDGSTDKSLEIIKSFNDERIIIINNESNLKLANTLNKGISLSNGKYIIRMDCDDISLPNRFEKQVKFMEENKDIGICGSWISTIGIRNNEVWKSPENPEEIKCLLLFHSTIFHPTVIMRKDLFDNYNLRYNNKLLYVEDYDLWVKASKITKISNIQEVLLYYRLHQDKTSFKHREIQRINDSIIRKRQLDFLFDNLKEEYLNIHNSISNWEIENSKSFIKTSELWFKELIKANNTKLIYNNDLFKKIIFNKWVDIINRSTKTGIWVWYKFVSSPLKKDNKINISFYIKLFIKSLFKIGSFKKSIKLKQMIK
jgi:glycosyltransferase involved in cell wall biosynthesis